MSSKYSISIGIGNIIPHGNTECTGKIIALWEELARLCEATEFTAPVSHKKGSQQVSCRLSMNVEAAINVMKAANDTAGSFDAYRLAHAADESLPVAASLEITIETDTSLTPFDSYEITNIYLQQIVLAMNIVMPGSVQMLNTVFSGEQAHQVEAPVFDSVVFFGARNAMLDHGWPVQDSPALEEVWLWLEKCETSLSLTAIKGINKVLFTMVKIAEQRRDYSARLVLLVLYQLEMLMNCHNANSYKTLRNRIRQVLGDIPEHADCLKELFKVRANLFGGEHPVSRPGLIQHSKGDELSEQLDQHDNMVEQGVLLTIALLQDLVVNQGTAYSFTENYTRTS